MQPTCWQKSNQLHVIVDFNFCKNFCFSDYFIFTYERKRAKFNFVFRSWWRRNDTRRKRLIIVIKFTYYSNLMFYLYGSSAMVAIANWKM